ncbi:hypothetical protein F5883DRAFT_670715 [Diaporthe sp. PMI_573]|nr:hypothetical protein F5883DRAFT_670715 [Diaporthaceae sp. PMI_573]
MSELNGGGSLDGADLVLFETGNLADATVVCGDRTWNVHKVILASRCRWFKAAFYGNMAEAVSSKVVLQEQDPDVVNIMLRFIYTKDTEMKELKRGKGLPSLFIRTFRLADFFQIDELKEVATEELQSYFAFDVPAVRMTTLSNAEEDGAQTPQWLTETLDAVEEAYKDRSTAPILKTLLDLIYERRHMVFPFQEAVALLDKIPEMGNDLIKDHITDHLTKQQTTYRLGLPVLKAIQSVQGVQRLRNYYAAGEKSTFSHGVVIVEPECVLYPVVGKSRFPFVPVDPQAETRQEYLDWISPRASAVKRMTSHPRSALVVVEMSYSKDLQLTVCFDACSDARLYVELYCRGNVKIARRTAPDLAAFTNLMPIESFAPS